MDNTTDILFNYLKNILYHPEQAQLDIDSLPPDFQKLGQGLMFLSECLQEERLFTKALARGDLSLTPPDGNNVLAGPAKALHSSLRHLQWQTQQVAKGDYSQRVDFMGEFSQAFNTMTSQLAERTEKLIEGKKQVEEKSQELKQSLELMLALTNYTRNMIFVFSAENKRKIFSNEPANWYQSAKPEHYNALKDHLRQQHVDDQIGFLNWDTEIHLESERETTYYGVESFFIHWGGEPAIVHILTDDTDRKKKENLIYNMAYLDPLTGLHNRRYAMDLMERWMQEGDPFLLTFIDVDYLKYCNDTFGHESGDKYLLDSAHLLQTLKGELCRIGGDEFFLLLPGTDADAQDKQLEQLREVFISQNDAPYPRSFSYATTAIPAQSEASVYDYIKMTDTKMYQYKALYKKPLADCLYHDSRT